MCDRQTLSTVRLARTINDIASDLTSAGLQHGVRACANARTLSLSLIRKLRRSTRGAALSSHARRRQSTDIFVKRRVAISFSYDFFETGIGDGPGTWHSARRTVLLLRTLASLLDGKSARRLRWPAGTATSHCRCAIRAIQCGRNGSSVRLR